MQDVGGGTDPGTRFLASDPTDKSGYRWDFTLHDGWFDILLKISRELMCLLLRLGGGTLADRKVG